MINSRLQSAVIWTNIWLGLPFKEHVKRLRWKYLLGVKVTVPWPVGHIEIGPDHRQWDDTMGAVKQSVLSADPNDHYRPWLEENIGRQGWDWDWRWQYGDGRQKLLARSNLLGFPDDLDQGNDMVIIKVRRKHKEKLAEFVLFNGR